MTRAALCLGLCLGLCLAFTAPAPAAKPLEKFDAEVGAARQALEERDAKGTMEHLRAAVAAAWRRLPFTVIESHLLAAPLTGHGHFIPRVDNVYRPSEPLILYLEPVGFKVEYDQEEKLYHFRLGADFNLVDAWGRVVSGRRDFGRFEGKTRRFPDRYPLSFTYSLSGLPPGDYAVETVIHDRLGQRSHTITTPIKIRSH